MAVKVKATVALVARLLVVVWMLGHSDALAGGPDPEERRAHRYACAGLGEECVFSSNSSSAVCGIRTAGDCQDGRPTCKDECASLMGEPICVEDSGQNCVASFANNPGTSFLAEVILMVRDPGVVSGPPAPPDVNDDPFNEACDPSDPDPIVAGLVLRVQLPDGRKFKLSRVFDPCNLGRTFPDGSTGMARCSSTPSGKRMFLCSRQGYLRLTETALAEGPELYLDDLSFLGIAQDLSSLFAVPALNPVIVGVRSDSLEDHRYDPHASVRRYLVEVAFSSKEKLTISGYVPEPAPPHVCGVESGGLAYLDPGEECDDGLGNGGPFSECYADCELKDNEFSTIPEDLNSCLTILLSQLDATRTIIADADSDGVRNSLDACPGTFWQLDEFVDASGCSRGQFCGRVRPDTRVAARRCRRLDWLNDEPVMTSKQADCAINDGGTKGDLTDDQCVAAAP